MGNEDLAASALRISAAYMAYNTARHRNSVGAERTRNSLEQCVKEMSRGHSVTMRIVKQRGSRAHGMGSQVVESGEVFRRSIEEGKERAKRQDQPPEAARKRAKRTVVTSPPGIETVEGHRLVSDGELSWANDAGQGGNGGVAPLPPDKN